MRTRVKICGLTRPDEAIEACRLGADAIGLVFYEKSPRAVTLDQALAIRRALPPWVCSVGLFVNSPADAIRATAQAVGLSHIQLHGDEPPELAAGLGRPVIKAIRLGPSLSRESKALDDLAAELKAWKPVAQAILFDADSAGFGGSGSRFDWGLLPRLTAGLEDRWVLSGGLDPGNVEQAICTTHAPCVDVSSGVEQQDQGIVHKGRKDLRKMREFLQAVAQADARQIPEL
jgi:phosphoribosylanthranilate isomerase